MTGLRAEYATLRAGDMGRYGEIWAAYVLKTPPSGREESVFRASREYNGEDYSGVRVLSGAGWGYKNTYSASRARDLGRYGEIRGDMGRSSASRLTGMMAERATSSASCSEIASLRGDMGRYGEIWGDMGPRAARLRACALSTPTSGREDGSTVLCSVLRAPREYNGEEESGCSGKQRSAGWGT